MLYSVLYASQGMMELLFPDIQLFHLDQWKVWTLTPNHKYIKIY